MGKSAGFTPSGEGAGADDARGRRGGILAVVSHEIREQEAATMQESGDPGSGIRVLGIEHC
jgi:hypothetical protein